MYPCAHRAIIHTDTPSPFSYAVGLAVKCVSSASALVSGLLILILPATIFGRVWTVIVNAANRVVLFWTVSNVSKEVSESVFAEPSFANVNSAPAVSRESFVFRVVAPRENPHVSVVFRRSTASVFSHVFAGSLANEAAARLGFTNSECSSRNNLFLSAIAHAIEKAKATFDVRQGERSKLSEFLTDSLRDFRYTHVTKAKAAFASVNTLSYA